MSGKKETSAHAFCGNCGCHVFRAPSKDRDWLEVNLHLFPTAQHLPIKWYTGSGKMGVGSWEKAAPKWGGEKKDEQEGEERRGDESAALVERTAEGKRREALERVETAFGSPRVETGEG